MVHIRVGQLSDEAGLFELARAFPTPTPPDVDVFAIALRAKLADRSSYLAVAEHEGSLIGYVAGYSHPTFYASGSTAWVDELLVDARFRGQGIGRSLMDAFEAWAGSHACTLVSLATRGAGPFYQRLGYASKAEYYKKYLGDRGR
jgi:GNAT superfamily N-acetyltransferase